MNRTVYTILILVMDIHNRYNMDIQIYRYILVMEIHFLVSALHHKNIFDPKCSRLEVFIC